MPIYEYICLTCNHEIETIRSMGQKDAPLSCPACGAEHTKRKLALTVAMSGGHTLSGAGGGCGCGDSCSGGNCGSCSR
jgi:putative FmdB family regulatory protein